MFNISHLKSHKYLVIFLFLLGSSAFALEINYQDKSGLFALSNKSGILVKSKYVGWQKDWKWDTPHIQKTSNNDSQYDFQLEFRKQDVKSFINIENGNKNKIKYNYLHQFSSSLSNTIGGGIEFNLNFLPQMKNFGTKEPQLLPGNSGWSWEFESGKVIEVRFTPNISRVYFERGNKSRIRALFFADTLKIGSKKMTMEVIVPEGTSIDNKIKTKTKTKENWLVNSVNQLGSFVDLSVLNDKPAGKKGFVTSVNNHFEFSDGGLAQFFGANVQANSLFVKDKRIIKQHAKRLAQLGFNLVRLHHHDSFWVKGNLIANGDTTQQINEDALDSYFWWIKCLRDEGIYVWVDLQVQRPWREGDNIPGWESDLAPKAKKGMNVGKGFVYLNRRMQALTKEFSKQLLTRINPYTQLALKDDPAMMGLMLTNENDLTHHFGNIFLKNKHHPYHQRLFDNEVSIFSKKFNLPERKVRETWKPGYSKFLLNDLEARFNEDMIHYLKDLGVKVPISTTSIWGRNASLFSLPALTVGDMVDAHSYANGGILKKSPLQKDPRYMPNFLHALGQGQIVNKPFTVTEYNVGQRDDLDNAFIPTVLVSVMAAFQGWDATMLYGYSQDGLNGRMASPWSSYRHPTILGVIPAMALLYRQGHVAQAKKTVVLAPANDEIFTKNISPKTSVTIRTALEQHRMVVAMPKINILPWLKPSIINKNSIVIHDLNTNLLPENQNYIESDTGEIKRNWQQGIMTVNTPKSQLAVGRIGRKQIDLDDVIIKSATSNAAIIFTSLDNRPINESESILVSAVAEVAKIKAKWKSSYISEPVVADLELSSIYDELYLIPMRIDGSEGAPRKIIKNNNGMYSFTISENDRTHWYIIRK